ncbi:transcriptional regulator [Pseudidiomarina aestuarii]|uniref:Transcriptional regulator n=1 Tax=Pseudidiomarina aestuarii TaxID=624146 RepID=A0A2T4D9D3_9GAMM|nr:transcriptional regulator [Pseudidiomarina aestuarii]PTB87424.1 transcriptional regulator [Pseudidiomarina aestuarii]PTB89506.1 transcriptional regulator [Pseudidiomarina aestuarii]PTB90441.1 transcriptional regulator [Pseudidiomarina aestuarii]
MYQYIESGLSNVYLKNGYSIDRVDGDEFVSIDDINGLHQKIGRLVVESKKPLSHEQFKFLRVELNLSQRVLATRFGVSEQTIARYEKGQSEIPRTTDAALRSLYMESISNNSPVSYFLDLLANSEAEQAAQQILLEEVEKLWEVTA